MFQFMSAFLLLFIGVIFAVILALLEWCYFKYFRKIFGKCGAWSCCNLLSMDFAESIQKPTSNGENKESNQQNSCINPICDLSIKSVTKDLQQATQRIKFLQSQLEQLHQHRRPSSSRSTRHGACLQNVSEIETVL